MSQPLDLDALRFTYESYLFQDLIRHPEIRAWREEVGRARGFNLRKRHLLGTAVRITDLLLPELHGIYQDCLQRVGVNTAEGYLYVFQASEYNAYVQAHQSHFDMVLSSAIVKDFKPTEIAFVIGHELGHVLFEHNDIPASALLFNEDGPELSVSMARRLIQWSRAAEISADRVGFLACGDLCAAANAFFKLASGLRLEDDNRVLRALHVQFDEIAKLSSEYLDGVTYASTHPLIPIRFKSLELISLDLLSLRNSGLTPRPRDLSLINQRVQDVLVQTEPVNLEAAEKPQNHQPGPAFGGILALSLLYVALAERTLDRERADFIADVVARYDRELDLRQIFEEAHEDPVNFRARLRSELNACQISGDEALHLLHFCALLPGRRRDAHLHRALRELCALLKVPEELADAVLTG